ncbi:MaoC/PaaZ C-terminal domain-containing protein [Actibacterium sp. D379-3]
MIAVPVLTVASDALGYFDTLTVGRRYAVGSTTISPADAIAFAEIYDPLGIHLSEAAATESIFGRIIVSGYQTLSTVHALRIKGGFLREEHVVCGAQVDALRFLKPVFPGDVLSVSAEIVDLKPPRRPGGFGIVGLLYEVRNQDGVLVLHSTDHHVLKLTPTGQGGA